MGVYNVFGYRAGSGFVLADSLLNRDYFMRFVDGFMGFCDGFVDV